MTETPTQPPQTNQQRRSFPARLWYGFWGWIGKQITRLWNRATDNGSFLGYVRVFMGVLLLIYLGMFIFAFWRAWVNPAGAASFFGYVRNLITIVLTMTGILIVVGFGVILIQVARFVNLLRSEVKPITHDAQEAAKNVKTTSKFVQKQAVEPIIKSQAFIAGLLRFLREIVSITRLLRQRDDDETSPKTSSTEATADE